MQEKNESEECLIQKELPFATITIQVHRVGDDCQILVYGGEKPHIGCVALAVPRPSLKGDGHLSCTSSVFNVTGHKDEAICRGLAEAAAVKYQAAAVCSGGFHMDGITPEQIKQVQRAVKEAADQLFGQE